MQISNNAPCPCNSGEKYKKCCKGKLSEEQEKHYALLSVERKIKDKLIKIAATEFGKEFLEDYSLKFNGKHFNDKEHEFDLLQFFEWFFLEARHESGKKILEWIIDNYQNLFSEEELLVISEWRNNTQGGIWEVISKDEGNWMISLKEIFSGKEFSVKDRMASIHLLKRDVIYSRIQNIFGKHYISGVAQTYPRLILNQLRDYVTFHYEIAKDETGIKYEDFMNTHGDVIIRFQPKKPKFISSSGDELKLCEQVYSILDGKHEIIIDWFDKNDNLFIITDVNEKSRKFSASITIKSDGKDAEVNDDGRRVMRVASHLIHPETRERILSAGSISIKGNKMKIFCFSEEVLGDIVRKIFDELTGIGSYLKLVKEDIETPEDILDSIDIEGPKKEENEKDPELINLGKEFLKDYYIKWCDMEIPALENKTPRNAIKTKEGKEKVNELLKDFENIDLHKMKDGEDVINSTEIIRKELGL